MESKRVQSICSINIVSVNKQITVANVGMYNSVYYSIMLISGAYFCGQKFGGKYIYYIMTIFLTMND